MYSCKIFGIYPRNHEHARDISRKKIFFSLIFEKVYLPVSKSSDTLIISGLMIDDKNTGVVNISTPP